MNKRLNDFSLPAGAPPESYDYRLISLARTDVVKSNAIPTEATAVVALATADATPLMESFEQWFNALRIVYGASEPNMKIGLTLLDEPPAEAPGRNRSARGLTARSIDRTRAAAPGTLSPGAARVGRVGTGGLHPGGRKAPPHSPGPLLYRDSWNERPSRMRWICRPLAMRRSLAATLRTSILRLSRAP